ncbi:MAG: GntR family transcriptional regulator [Desulfatiglandaceae bacterium]
MIKIESIVDNTRKYLEECIFKGHYRPGDRLKEQDLASTLGISRPPLREALKLLESDGLIIRKPNRGVFVTTISETDAWEIYTLKAQLYRLATRLAFNRITKEHTTHWQQLLKKMEVSVRMNPPDLVLYQGLHEQYHGLMIDISGHQRLKRLIQNLHNQVKRFSFLSLTIGTHLVDSLKFHKAILAAIEARDLDLTLRLTEKHVEEGLNVVKCVIIEETALMAAGVSCGSSAGIIDTASRISTENR